MSYDVRLLRVFYDVILTALTAGGSSDAEIATPTSDAVYSPSTARATPAPLGMATRIPTHKERYSHLELNDDK